MRDILMIVLCAVLSGVEDGVGMEAFVEEKEGGLQGFLDLPNGIPLHDTLSDVMGRMDLGAFQRAFSAWARAALPGLANEQVCLEGKAVHGSRNGASPAVHRSFPHHHAILPLQNNTLLACPKFGDH